MSGITAKMEIPENESVFWKGDPASLGQTLITALTNFIVPLIQGDTTAPGIGTDGSYVPGHTIPIVEDRSLSADDAVRPGAGLTTEGQDLLTSLKRFAASLVRSPNDQQTERLLPGNLDEVQEVVESNNSRAVEPVDGWDAYMWESSGFDLIFTGVKPCEGWDAYMWESSGLGLIVSGAFDMKRQQLIDRCLEDARDVVFNHMPIRLLMFNQEGKDITLVERSQVMEILSAEINSDADLSFPYRDWQFEKYAILSHTWFPRGEVTYSEWRNHTVPLDTQSPGYDKLAKFCQEAAKQGFRLGWMDTGAEVCFAYLAETTSLDDMDKDKWFTRGWTLQELIAPLCIKFFSKNWTALSNEPADRSDKVYGPLISKICAATGLYKEELSDPPHRLHILPIWRKMQWASNRQVTREEDTAYSLMGIFDISMPTGYGEGAEHAFLRLVREILNSRSRSVSKLEIVNWGFHPEHRADPFADNYVGISSSALIPSSPCMYLYANSDIHFPPSSSPITLSYMGLCVPVLLLPSTRADRELEDLDISFCPKGDYSAIFNDRSESYIYKILDSALFINDSISWHSYSTFAVLNIADEATNVLLPENGSCLAVELFRPESLIDWEIPEDLQFQQKRGRHHLTFDIVCHNNSSFRIPKDELNRHGMTLRTMYL